MPAMVPGLQKEANNQEWMRRSLAKPALAKFAEVKVKLRRFKVIYWPDNAIFFLNFAWEFCASDIQTKPNSFPCL
ncbi:MAG: hypothetical protein A2512_08940 [Deltaproteobacteria bacterium RIFOXYD12_FULL_56_24]|nr:MAG: hypothetical protein A2512_08940 [Deltaproteobacteria bacterium RIFOXYD12_FULL_56_24]